MSIPVLDLATELVHRHMKERGGCPEVPTVLTKDCAQCRELADRLAALFAGRFIEMIEAQKRHNTLVEFALKYPIH